MFYSIDSVPRPSPRPGKKPVAPLPPRSSSQPPIPRARAPLPPPPPPLPPSQFSPRDSISGENDDGAKFKTRPSAASDMPMEEVSFSLKLRGARKPAPLPPTPPPPAPVIADAEADRILERRLQGRKLYPAVETSLTLPMMFP